MQEAKRAAKLIKNRFGIEEVCNLTVPTFYWLNLTFQIEEWMTQVDFDNDGVLTYEEFKYSVTGNINMRDL